MATDHRKTEALQREEAAAREHGKVIIGGARRPDIAQHAAGWSPLGSRHTGRKRSIPPLDYLER